MLLFLPSLDEQDGTNQNPGLRAKLAVSAALGVPLCDVTPRLHWEGNALYLEADRVQFGPRRNEIVAQNFLKP